MSCPCNTPTSSGGNLPASSGAFLTNPVTAPSESCYTPPENLCAPRISRLRQIVDFLPGWLQKLTPASMGKLLIGVGSTLHYFWSPNKGPLYFDGENITIGAEGTLTAAAKAESVHEYGHLALAKKVSKPQILPNGQAANVDFYEFGVQAVGEIGVGHMLGLTKDNLSGSVRVDVIAPEDLNLIAKGLPDGFRRFGVAETMIDGGCGTVAASKFYNYRGAVYGEDEILKERESGLPAVLVPVKKASGSMTYVLGTDTFTESEGVTETEFEDLELRIPVVEPIYGDSGCPGLLTGVRRFHIPFPRFMTNGASLSNEILLEDPLEVFSATKSTGTVQILDEVILPHEDVPESADYLIYSIYARAIATAGSGTRITTVSFNLSEAESGEDVKFIRSSDTVKAVSELTGIAETDLTVATVKVKIRAGGCRLFGSIATIAAGSGGSNLANLYVHLVGYGQTGGDPE